MVSFTIHDRPADTSSEALTDLLWLLKVRLYQSPSSLDSLQEVIELLSKEAPSTEENNHLQTLLQALPSPESYPESLPHANLWVIRADMPNLDAMLSRFDQFHTLNNGEVYWVMEGEGVFGLRCPDDPQLAIRLKKGQGLYIPAGVERYFHPTATMRVKLLRLRSGDGPWAPHYTDSQRKIKR